jgi:hypothetical protein
MQGSHAGRFRQGVIDMGSFVSDQLIAKAQLYTERNKLYGGNYKRFGAIMVLLLNGQKLDASDPLQMNRLGIFFQVVSKLTRYAENFERGGHPDSLDDTAVYSMMLQEIDFEARQTQAERLRREKFKEEFATEG